MNVKAGMNQQLEILSELKKLVDDYENTNGQSISKDHIEFLKNYIAEMTLAAETGLELVAFFEKKTAEKPASESSHAATEKPKENTKAHVTKKKPEPEPEPEPTGEAEADFDFLA